MGTIVLYGFIGHNFWNISRDIIGLDSSASCRLSHPFLGLPLMGLNLKSSHPVSFRAGDSRPDHKPPTLQHAENRSSGGRSLWNSASFMTKQRVSLPGSRFGTAECTAFGVLTRS